MDPNDWTLTGNAGTDPATNFLGTTDNQPLVIKTNGAESLRIDSTGNVGIGTTGPNQKLDVYNGIARFWHGGTSEYSEFRDRNELDHYTSAGNPATLYIQYPATSGHDTDIGHNALYIEGNGGNVGIRTTNPKQALQVTGQGFFTSSDASPDPGDGSESGIRIGYQSADDYGYINANTTGVAAKSLVLQQNGGNVGIGTKTPGARLEVRGDVLVTGDIILRNADCAEEFDIVEAAEIEPGTVMIIDQDGALHQSQRAYDKRVAGVISGAGEYKPGLILDRQQSQDNRAPIALVGKVYCKVDAQYAPIEVGDLLTTSLTPGHAMKAIDPLKAFGSVIGKALRPLRAGRQMIPILIALQ